MNITRFVTALLIPVCLASTPAGAVKRDPFLDEIQRRCFLFFWKETDPVTGVTKDRANNFKPDNYDIGSIAATGFALSALPIGVERGWISREKARERALLTLRFFNDRAPRIHGVFPHFLKFGTGDRAWECEYSTIDTTLLAAGAITAGEYFGGEVRLRAERLYQEIDWKYWTPNTFVSMGSRPQEKEYLGSEYDGYSEALLLYGMAAASPTHPIPASTWHKLGRWVARYGSYSSIAGSSLFVNQYPHLWFDLRGLGDGKADYWENARTNTLANRAYCITRGSRFRNFGPLEWGLTAGDGPDGYEAFAAEPGGAFCNGTINPHAAGGSYMFTPMESREVLRAMLDKYRYKIWGRYGFSDGFNVTRNWWAPDVVGIDTGATLLSIENHRTGLNQRLFMRNPIGKTAITRIGMKSIIRPKGTEPIRLSGTFSLGDLSRDIEVALPARPSAWKGRKLVLYGGVIDERTVRVSVNGKDIGAAAVPRGLAYAVGFSVPDSALKWGASNRLTVTLEAGRTAPYGPLLLGPLEGMDYKPLKVLLTVPNRPPGK